MMEQIIYSKEDILEQGADVLERVLSSSQNIAEAYVTIVKELRKYSSLTKISWEKKNALEVAHNKLTSTIVEEYMYEAGYRLAHKKEPAAPYDAYWCNARNVSDKDAIEYAMLVSKVQELAIHNEDDQRLELEQKLEEEKQKRSLITNKYLVQHGYSCNLETC